MNYKRLFINLIVWKSNLQTISSFFSKIKKTLRESLSPHICRNLLKGSAILTIILLLIVQSVKSQNAIHHRDSLKTKHLWLLSHTLPGFGQIYNKQYWKTPVFYAGMGSMLYLGVNANKTYNRYMLDYNKIDASDPNKEFFKERYTKMKHTRNLYYAGVGAFYIASVVDAVIVYNKNSHSPATASILSTLVPGLGQVYNKKYWKVPIVYGGLSTLYFMVDWNNRRYLRFKNASKLYPHDEFNGVRTRDELNIYRDSYRKNRDVCFLGFVAVYVLNILDANVDANFYDWNVDDNLAFRIEPTIINDNFASINYTQPAFGLSCKFNF